jgi:hypothetical protein
MRPQPGVANCRAFDVACGLGPEQTEVRLSDGTRLVEAGALAPAVTLNRFDLTLYTFFRPENLRLQLVGEDFFRWLTNIGGTGETIPSP